MYRTHSLKGSPVLRNCWTAASKMYGTRFDSGEPFWNNSWCNLSCSASATFVSFLLGFLKNQSADCSRMKKNSKPTILHR